MARILLLTLSGIRVIVAQGAGPCLRWAGGAAISPVLLPGDPTPAPGPLWWRITAWRLRAASPTSSGFGDRSPAGTRGRAGILLAPATIESFAEHLGTGL